MWVQVGKSIIKKDEKFGYIQDELIGRNRIYESSRR
jgi:hypothetical protein